jgi:putative ABC transport system substrate-binding protein
MPVIGYLHAGSPESNEQRVAGFRRGLKETGYIEGENVAIEFRWAHEQIDRLPALAADLVRRQVSVIATPGNTPSALAAKAATSTIPIVFGIGSDPVHEGIVQSLARPGGNVTGIAFLTGELGAKRLDLLHELLPTATRVAHLVNPRNPLTAPLIADVQTAASSIGMQIEVVATKGKSIRPLPVWCKSGSMRCWSVMTRCCTDVASKSPSWPRATSCLRYIPLVIIPTLAG